MALQAAAKDVRRSVVPAAETDVESQRAALVWARRLGLQVRRVLESTELRVRQALWLQAQVAQAQQAWRPAPLKAEEQLAQRASVAQGPHLWRRADRVHVEQEQQVQEASRSPAQQEARPGPEGDASQAWVLL